MAIAKLYNQDGEQTGEVKLNPVIFEVEVNQATIHQVITALLANKRKNIASVKDKSQVRGGGKKPWKQKGTGRARHGSIRSPLWKGGGVTFGPNDDRNFTLKINKKMKTKALFMVLSDKAKDNNISIFEDIKLSEIKTSLLNKLLIKLGLGKRKLIVLDKADQNVYLSSRNLEKVNVVTADSLNVYDTLVANSLIFTKQALTKIEEVYIKKQ